MRDMESWKLVQLTDTIAMRLPPWLELRPYDHVIDRTRPHSVLSSYRRQENGEFDRIAWLLGWVYEWGGFPTGAYPPERQARFDGHEQCDVEISGISVKVATWRTRTVDGPQTYDVAAFWKAHDRWWVQLASQAPTRALQEDVLAALHSLTSTPRTEGQQ